MEILIPAWVDGTLRPVEKLQTHLRGLRHKAVSVFVMRDDKTLLQRRALEKYHTPWPLGQRLLHPSGMGRGWARHAQSAGWTEELGVSPSSPCVSRHGRISRRCR